MLPKMNGRDLAAKIKSEVNSSLPVILMSGIYKDKNFIRDAIASTGAATFLTKPFDIKDLLGQVDELFAGQVEAPLDPLYELLRKDDLPAQDRISAINETKEIHAFDLPWAVQSLLHPKISGYLNITSDNGEVASVGISQGRIVQISRADAKSYFGVLLVEMGFISQAEMDEAISRGAKNRKVGERLVEANVLSPHAIEIVLAEQQALRLSTLLKNVRIQIGFNPTDDVREETLIDRGLLADLIGDWVKNKISLDYLKSFYLRWEGHSILKGADFAGQPLTSRLPVMQAVPNLHRELLNGTNLAAGIAKLSEKHPEADIYPALHVALTYRQIRFGEAAKVVDFKALEQRFERLVATLKTQNHFERLGLTRKPKDPEIKRAYHDLAKLVHPDKLPADAPSNLKSLASEAMALAQAANDVLSSPERREAYIIELEQGNAAAVLEAEQLADQARSQLTRGDTKKGLELVQKAAQLAPPNSETKLILIWAKLRTTLTKSPKLIETLKSELSSIPPEDRHNSTFFFVKGLVQVAANEAEPARKSFENAISLDPDFIDAKRELNLINLNSQRSKKSTDLLSGDLRDLVGGLFKRR
jgi:CheY-like chemotaxis protein